MNNDIENKWQEHSDRVFTAISTSASDYNMAQQMVMLYVLDTSTSRAGISHALKRLEQHYKKENKNENF